MYFCYYCCAFILCQYDNLSLLYDHHHLIFELSLSTLSTIRLMKLSATLVLSGGKHICVDVVRQTPNHVQDGKRNCGAVVPNVHGCGGKSVCWDRRQLEFHQQIMLFGWPCWWNLMCRPSDSWNFTNKLVWVSLVSCEIVPSAPKKDGQWVVHRTWTDFFGHDKLHLKFEFVNRPK